MELQGKAGTLDRVGCVVGSHHKLPAEVERDRCCVFPGKGAELPEVPVVGMKQLQQAGKVLSWQRSEL